MVLEEERIKAELDASIAAERLALEAKERMRRETEEALLKRRVELEAELERDKARIEEEGIRAEIAAKAEQERLNEDVVLRRMQLQASLDTQKLVKSIAAVGAQAAMLSRDLVEQPMRLAYLLAIVLGVFAAYYAIKEGVALLRAVVQARLGRPSLVRETSMGLALPLVLTWSYWLPERTSTGIRRAQGLFEDIILSEHDKGSVVNLAVATRNSKRNGIPYRHVLLYGPPGTGKTLIARRIAMSSGMDYAIMSGGDVGPLGEDAVTQLHGLFRWAARSSRGLVVFVDEAEAFLSARSGGAGAGDDVHRRHALNALLYQTGTQSKAFMLSKALLTTTLLYVLY
jgi:ATPase family AAA domain-containing protein 3A/B